MTEICFTCLDSTTLNYIQLNGTSVESIETKRKLTVCVPDAAMYMVENPVICNSCYKALNLSYKFISECRLSNEFIVQYRQSVRVDRETKPLTLKELQNVLYYKNGHSQFDTNSHLKSESINGLSVCNNNTSEILFKNERELDESDSCSYLENDQSINNKSLEIKLDCDKGTTTAEDVKRESQNERELYEPDSSSYLNNKQSISIFLENKLECNEGTNTAEDVKRESQNERELYEPDSSSYLNNKQSISKFLENKLECNEGTTTSEDVKTVIKSEAPDVDKKKNINVDFIQKIEVMKDCIVKLTPLNIKHAEVMRDCFVKLTPLTIKHAPQTDKKMKGIKVKRNVTSNNYECNICGYTSGRNSNFRRHMRIHNGDKPYSCDKCSYSTSAKCNLQSHMDTHLEMKPYQCDKCKFNTAHQSNFTKHMYTHQDKNMFNGDRCQFTTANQDALKKHTSTHTDHEIYQCDKCKLSVSDKYKLDRHKLTHINEKIFKCEICEYSSVRKDTLQRHVKRKHQQL